MKGNETSVINSLESEYRQLRRHYNQLFEFRSWGIAIIKDQKLVRVNRSLNKMLGYHSLDMQQENFLSRIMSEQDLAVVSRDR